MIFKRLLMGEYSSTIKFTCAFTFKNSEGEWGMKIDQKGGVIKMKEIEDHLAHGFLEYIDLIRQYERSTHQIRDWEKTYQCPQSVSS